MRTTLFNISLEDDELSSDLEADGSGSDINVSEVIENDEAVEEIAEDQEVVDEAAEAVEDSIEVVEELQDQVDVQEAILEQKPEEITAETVQTAQEEYQIQLASLGIISYEELAVQRISVESMVNNPVEAFRVSTESIKETIKKIWEKIKQVVRSLINAIKNIFAKIKTMFQKIFFNNKKILEKIQELLKANPKAKFDLQQTDIDGIKNIAGPIIVYSDGNVTSNSMIELGRAIISTETYSFDKTFFESLKSGAASIINKAGNLIGITNDLKYEAKLKLINTYKTRKAAFDVFKKEINDSNAKSLDGVIINVSGNRIGYFALDKSNKQYGNDETVKYLELGSYNLNKLSGMFDNLNSLEKHYSAFVKAYANEQVLSKCEAESSKLSNELFKQTETIVNELTKGSEGGDARAASTVARACVNTQLQIVRNIPSNYLKYVALINKAVTKVLSKVEKSEK